MQNALVISQKQAQFSLATRSIPTAGPGELLIKVKATALNPIDWKNQKWDFLINEYPAVLGWDIAGDILTVGEGVTRFAVGDKVFGQGLAYSDFGGFQEYAKLKEEFTAKVPNNTTYEEASTFPVALSAAFVMLYAPKPNGMGLKPLVPSGQNAYSNRPILIIGGASSVGQFAIQLAKASGFSPIITTASLKHTEKLKALGATHIIDRNIPLKTVQSQLLEIVGSATSVEDSNKGLISHVFDTISDQETQTAAYSLLAPGGVLALVLPPLVPTDSGDKSVVVTMAMPTVPEAIEELKVLYATVTSLVENGDLKPSKVEVISGGLAGITEGLKRLENNQVSGVKLVVQPSESR